VCTAGESSTWCPGDCASCASVPAAGRIVDESEACFTGGGDPTYLRHVTTAGWEHDLIWTHATAAATPANFGVWSLTFDQAGRYSIEAYTAAPWAQSTRARYVVAHAGGTDSAVVNQSSTDGWTTVGSFEFAAGGSQSVRLDDNTGEPASANVQLVFDALRITRLDPPVSTSDGGDVSDAFQVSDASDASQAHDGGDASASDSAVGSDAGRDVANAEGGSTTHAESGCACRATPGSGRTRWFGLLVLLALVRRPRRRHERGR
jgi:MYXO-CTERM domain-containing protein